jgi:uncharacterized protein YkwD
MPARAKLILVTVCGLLAFPAAAGATGLTSSEASLLREINVVRTAHGLSAFRYDSSLSRAARAHTRAMARANIFTHGAFTTRMRRFHVTGPRVGENLA